MSVEEYLDDNGLSCKGHSDHPLPTPEKRDLDHPLPPPGEGNLYEEVIQHLVKIMETPGVVTGNRGRRNTKNYMKLPYNPSLKERARALRKAGNLSEVLFWNQVKNKRFKGFDFDRQKIIGNYIADFYCANCNVVIEIDGKSHDNKQDYDAKRDAYLESLGLTVIHIPVLHIMKNMDSVMEMLLEHPALNLSNPSDVPHSIETAFSLTDIFISPLPTIGRTSQRTPNLNLAIVQQIAEQLGLTFTPEKENGNLCFANNTDELRDEFKQTFAPIDLLDYIYAVLHSPTYREKYKEFLKIDFPRVPYPKDATTFWQLVKLGGEIRQIHLLESPKVEQYITQYPIDGNNVVGKIRFEENYEITDGDHVLFIEPSYPMGRVYINDTQYFQKVPKVAWEFYIGGYQPAQKWLKDRKDRQLTFEDILHYQKIIVALTETDRLMKEIDGVEVS